MEKGAIVSAVTHSKGLGLLLAGTSLAGSGLVFGEATPLQKGEPTSLPKVDASIYAALLQVEPGAEHQIVLVKVRKSGYEIVARGQEISQCVVDLRTEEIDLDDISFNILINQEEAQFSEAISIAASVIDDYHKFIRALSEDINRLTQGAEELSDILTILNVTADILSVTGAVGGLGLWLIRKLIEKHKNQNPENLLINIYISRATKVCDFFSQVPKSRIAEISEATGISKENLLYILKSMSYQHEAACFWKPPQISKKNARRAARISSGLKSRKS